MLQAQGLGQGTRTTRDNPWFDWLIAVGWCLGLPVERTDRSWDRGFVPISRVSRMGLAMASVSNCSNVVKLRRDMRDGRSPQMMRAQEETRLTSVHLSLGGGQGN